MTLSRTEQLMKINVDFFIYTYIMVQSKASCCLFFQVYMLGQGEESKEWLNIPGHSTDKLFLSHVTNVIKGIRETYPSLSVIMWDDMLRNMTSNTIKGELRSYVSLWERTASENHFHFVHYTVFSYHGTELYKISLLV